MMAIMWNEHELLKRRKCRMRTTQGALIMPQRVLAKKRRKRKEGNNDKKGGRQWKENRIMKKNWRYKKKNNNFLFFSRVFTFFSEENFVQLISIFIARCAFFYAIKIELFDGMNYIAKRLSFIFLCTNNWATHIKFVVISIEFSTQHLI